MKHDPGELWKNFRESFACALQKVHRADPSALERHWASQTARTLLYTGKVLNHVATRLDMKCVPERFKVDYAIGLEEGGTLVPLIFIESENQANGADWEVMKLCSLRAPLRVLICCTEWSEEPGYWPGGGRRLAMVKRWSRIIQAHNRHLPDHGKIALLVGEWNKRNLRFYANAWDARGQMSDVDEIIFSQSMDTETDAGHQAR